MQWKSFLNSSIALITAVGQLLTREFKPPHGENVRRARGPDGKVGEVLLGGVRLPPEAEAAAELEKRYGS
jgi:hypothetical protein